MSIEQKIASLIEESKVLQDEQVEEITEEEVELDEEELDEASRINKMINKYTDAKDNARDGYDDMQDRGAVKSKSKGTAKTNRTLKRDIKFGIGKMGKPLNLPEEEELDLDEEQLNELSPKTLGSYVKKATSHGQGSADGSIHNLATQAADDYHSGIEGGPEDKKSYKRSKGITRAVNKLTKEEFESEEELEEGKWNYPSEYTKKPDAEQRERDDVFGSTQKADRKEFRKVAKAKAHKALMAGKLTKEEFESDEEQSEQE